MTLNWPRNRHGCGPRSTHMSWMGCCQRLMHEQPHRAWTASTLATCVAMSRSAFSARFRRVIGEPPMRYLTRYRLARAADRLRTSGESLVDIALQTGYASDVALSKAFKRHFGMFAGCFSPRDAEGGRACAV